VDQLSDGTPVRARTALWASSIARDTSDATTAAGLSPNVRHCELADPASRMSRHAAVLIPQLTRESASA
jgi:hypothetical protein